MKKLYLILTTLVFLLSCSKNKEYIYIDDEKPAKWNIKEYTTRQVFAFFDKNEDIKVIGDLMRTIATYSDKGIITSSNHFRGYISKLEVFNGGVVLKELKDYEQFLKIFELDEKGRTVLEIYKTRSVADNVMLKDTIGNSIMINTTLFVMDSLFLSTINTDCKVEINTKIYNLNFVKVRYLYNDTDGTATAIIARSEDGKTYVDDTKHIYKLDKYGEIDFSEGHEEYQLTSNFVEIYGERIIEKDAKGNIILDYSYYLKDGKKVMSGYTVNEYVYFD